MLVMERQGAVTFLISEDGRQVTSFTHFAQTPCDIDGVAYRLTREGRERFWLEGPTGTVGVAHRAGRGELLVSSDPHELYLRRASRFSRSWELHDGGQVVGSCRSTTFSGQSDLPAHLPLPVRVFAFYVVIATQTIEGGFALWA